MTHLEYLTALADQLDRLRDVTVVRGADTTDDTARGDTAESLAASLRRRKIVRER